ncbi:MAG: prepilin-type N-terminal cleavage/methylation domain-containing protein [Planctomycetaceae bacterium]|nr:prepilin-type N-terminal cleavage/methylation domain-containing protein [Planctomycetaceae bacterium]
MRKGFTLIELLIVVAIIAILAAIAVPNFLEAQVRSKVSRVQSDQRSMATALASYYVDNNGYPMAVVLASGSNSVRNRVATGSTASTTSQAVSIPATAATVGSTFNTERPTFALAGLVSGRPEFHGLTTPISYITTYFNDPFSNGGRETFTYLPDGPGWLLISFGPDADQGTSILAGNQLVRESNTQFTTPTETPFNGRDLAGSRQRLLIGSRSGANGAYTYDPTNGTTSGGDVWKLAD